MQVQTYETIKLESYPDQEGVVQITLNRPNSMNAMNTKMALEIIEVLDELKYDENVRVLIITGSGKKSFCVGADLKERNGMSEKEWKKQHDSFEQVTLKIREFPYPVIGAVNGYALGGGMEIALSCDIRTAAPHAGMGLPESKLGLIPGIGGTQLLPRIIPLGLAKEMLFTGKRIGAEVGMQLGIINHIFSSETLTEETVKLAETIAANAPLSLKALKKAVNKGAETDLATGLALELEAYYRCANSEDRLEGIYAFNEKRPPQWKGK
ncbi:enoyl-CoA hydratase/carnithine racemase [Cytobacillus firmus]|uniref:Enoyl-CoA hydratase/carnithine racemase n=2 Tax=Cytobacillus TaxID=2675230 RepID=A0A366JQK0_CYTFI|nr:MULTISPECIES: enoyl-CoA hydratase-related protein [Cytobacillus]RBP90579.1 enoyl-CoA hydratase/carnithine racemase [Cytobacillus firmus]TDX46161.1 enoyl-CoA hydratase/carnithine racemase [Cytobacillus oceanisediminis]